MVLFYSSFHVDLGLNSSMYIAPLAAHLEAENVEFMQFAFRWMNCLLMREISVQNTIRMWDTYLVRVISPSGPRSNADDSPGGRHRCVLTVPSICLFCVPCQVE